MSRDSLTTEERSVRMSRVRNKDTKPELFVRRLVHSMGYRYRLHSRALPGHPDLVFPRHRKVIFVHGCFWHRHAEDCPLTRLPKSRLDFWLSKFEANKARDRENMEKLNGLGWQVLVVWECELKDRDKLATSIRGFLSSDALTSSC